MFVSDEEKDRAMAIAGRLDTYIPGEISQVMWPIPIFEALLDRIEALEKKLKERDQI